MKDFYLVFKNLTRNKMRLTLNGFAIFIAFLLFGVLSSIKGAFDAGIDLSADNRLVVVNKINFTQPLPIAHVQKIRAMDGVKDVTWANWFGAYHQDARKPLVGMAVDPESYLKVYDEILLDEEFKKAWYAERQGVIVGERMATAKGWKVGDRIPISSSIFSKSDGSHVWDMVIIGIFTGKDRQLDTNYLLFHYKYFIETQTFGRDWIGWAILTTDDAMLNDNVANSIDRRFANSPAETETTSEKQFTKAFIAQIGSVGLILTSVVLAAFFTILLIVGNSMALAIRERTAEIAVLKTLGFQAMRVFRMILTESIVLALMGGLLGLGFAHFIVTGASQQPQLQSILPNLILSGETILKALAYMVLLGLLTGFFPAWRAMRLNTLDALSRR
ncbi:ABC transporter permease [Teredinibacter haidensis]|uniref:ABC transporter permease n=1 Tax=Teredinibacter haidensis TaxID=2731755 RepID=UPI000948EAA2|nr:FtsX-like permease family protein [Teredinibacter haidensis]